MKDLFESMVVGLLGAWCVLLLVVVLVGLLDLFS